jgi:cell division cycle 20-like protein 1 (cofactor of APC complex)
MLELSTIIGKDLQNKLEILLSFQVTKLCDLGPNDSVSSVGWTQRGTYLAVGTNLGEVQIWDAARCKKVRTMGGHRVRVGCLAWSSHMLSSGSRDRNILQRDVRAPDDYVSKLIGHKSEVRRSSSLKGAL